MYPCQLNRNAIYDTYSSIERGLIIPSSNSTFSIEFYATMKNYWNYFDWSCSRMKMVNQSFTDFQKYFQFILQLWRLLRRSLHYFRLQVLNFMYCRIVQRELRQTIGMLKIILLRWIQKQSLNSSMLFLYLYSPVYTPNSSSNS